jgi:hypothetical protein
MGIPFASVAYYSSFNEPASPLVIVALLGGLGLVLLLSNCIDRKRRSYPVGDDEWVLFYSDEISRAIENLLSSEHQAMKNRYRKKALTSAKRFLRNMEQNWNVGSFKLVEDFVGTTVYDFMNNFEFVILPTIKAGDEKQLLTLANLLKALKVDSQAFQLSHLNQFNTTVNNYVAKGFVSRINQKSANHNSIELHPALLKNPVIVIALMVIASAIAGAVFFYLGLSKEFSVGSSITIFALLFGKYKFRNK